MPFDINSVEYDAKLASHLQNVLPQQGAAQRSLYSRYGKTVLDLSIIALTLPITLPLIALFAVLIAFDGGNPFYTQLRVGRGGKLFRMFKLRTMVPNADLQLERYLADNPDARAEWDATQKLKRDPRITLVGRILRKTSLDELPQIFNVFTGAMSLVGPRPMMVEQTELYHGDDYYALRPGMTGFWQISDRNECNFVGRVRYDSAYRRSVSLATDLFVIARTFVVVLRGTGY
jgi:lipopolysaccharide/colanic/teichoic acid biosynthesis glycosyltransferase